MTTTILSAQRLAQSALYTASYEAKQTIRNSAKDALIAAHPHLMPAGDSLTTAAKNIRIELKAAFPGVKFSVKVERFSMGDSISVNWTDGPTSDRVSAITCKYKSGSFNGSEDIYEYSMDAWNDAFGDAKCITTSRSFSPSIQQWINDKNKSRDYNDYWNNPYRIINELNIKAVK